MIEITDKIKLYNKDNLQIMAKMENESIDVILTDPPYLYLKNQKLERPFDEQLFFSECKRVLKRDGFIILFGRGTSFYRWNTILADLGFTFKEEIVWNKSHCTSPLMALSRVHETISIFTKGKGTINKVKVPYLEMKSHDIDSIIGDVKRMRSILKNTKSLEAVLAFLEDNKIKRDDYGKGGVTHNGVLKPDRSVSVMLSTKNGLNEKNIIRTDRTECKSFTKFGVNADERKTGDRCVNVAQSICFGLNEKSIINLYDYNSKNRAHNDKNNVVASPNLKNGDRCVYVISNIVDGLNEKSIINQVRDHYSAIHPTQKPVRLMERLLNLTVKGKNAVVFDPFAGSCPVAVACHNLSLNFIGCEVDKEYFNNAVERLKNECSQQKINF